MDASSRGVIRGTAREFRQFLQAIETEISADLDIHLVLDNLSTHKAPTVKRWLAQHPRYHLHFTPTSASWLNRSRPGFPC